MSNKSLTAKEDNERLLRTIFLGPVGNYIYEQLTMSDYDRQERAIRRMRESGMEHGHVKMTSSREGKIITKCGGVAYKQKHKGEYTW